MADLIPTIGGAAANPRSAAADGTQAMSHSLPDLIAADRYTKSAAAGPLGGIRFSQFVASDDIYSNSVTPGSNIAYPQNNWYSGY